MILKSIKTIALAAMALVSVNAAGQDLLARQAPIDRKLKAVDSLALVRQIKAEKSVYPAYSLYPKWENVNAHVYVKNIPDTFRIDLTGFCMPTTHTRITSKCGPRWRRMHEGLDIKVYIGDTIRAAFDGKVRMVKNQGRRRGYGKYIVIRHDNGLETIYGHLSKQIVKENEYVKAGDVIGLGGNTGFSTGSHLHFEVRFLGEVINPEFMFDFPNQDIVADNYLFIRGANRYTYQRTRALSALKEGKFNRSAGKNASFADKGTIHYHKIRKGDTLGRISRMYHVSIDRLCQMNGIKRTTILRPGQILRCS